MKRDQDFWEILLYGFLFGMLMTTVIFSITDETTDNIIKSSKPIKPTLEFSLHSKYSTKIDTTYIYRSRNEN